MQLLFYQPGGLGDAVRQYQLCVKSNLIDNVKIWCIHHHAAELFLELGLIKKTNNLISLYPKGKFSSANQLLSSLNKQNFDRVVTTDLGYGPNHIFFLKNILRLKRKELILLERKDFNKCRKNFNDNEFTLNEKNILVHYRQNDPKLPSENMIIDLLEMLKIKARKVKILLGPGDDIETEFLPKNMSLKCNTPKDLIRELKKSNLVIHFDTGIGHLADFLNVHNITITGPTVSNLSAPFISDYSINVLPQIDCWPCYKKGTFNRCPHKACFNLSAINLLSNQQN